MGGAVGLLLAVASPRVDFVYCYEAVVIPPEMQDNM